MFLISGSNLTPQLSIKIFEECSNSSHWHKFSVSNIGQFTNSFILTTILDFLHPAKLTPVNVSRNHKSLFFLAKDCIEAIMKLVHNDLTILNPRNLAMPITICIWANFSPPDTFDVCLEDNIKKIVQKRFGNPKRGTLDLTQFYTDPDLKEYFTLSDPKSLAFVMHFVITIQPKNIILCKNGIKDLTPFVLLGKNILTSIDLEANQISSFDDLKPLTHFNALIRINLRNNPISKGKNGTKYLATIQKMFPKLRKLDRVNIKGKRFRSGPIPYNDNFLCSVEAGDLAEQFIEYYFTMYDKEDRTQIKDLYHAHAMFSVTCRIIPNSVTNKGLRFNHYIEINRNLYTSLNILSLNDKLLIRGRGNIMRLYKKLPRSMHDPHKINTDVIYYTEKCTVIVVHGVFCEMNQYIGFTRNFVLECDDNGGYCIVNEQLHVYNAMNHQIDDIFKVPPSIKLTCQPVPFLQKQYSELQDAVGLITNLNAEYSRRMLEEFHYDLKATLINFMDRHINNQIPEEAFLRDKNSKKSVDKSRDIPLSNEIVSKTAQSKGLFSNLNLWRMLLEERLNMPIYQVAPNFEKIMTKTKQTPAVNVINSTNQKATVSIETETKQKSTVNIKIGTKPIVNIQTTTGQKSTINIEDADKRKSVISLKTATNEKPAFEIGTKSTPTINFETITTQEPTFNIETTIKQEPGANLDLWRMFTEGRLDMPITTTSQTAATHFTQIPTVSIKEEPIDDVEMTIKQEPEDFNDDMEDEVPFRRPATPSRLQAEPPQDARVSPTHHLCQDEEQTAWGKAILWELAKLKAHTLSEVRKQTTPSCRSPTPDKVATTTAHTVVTGLPPSSHGSTIPGFVPLCLQAVLPDSAAPGPSTSLPEPSPPTSKRINETALADRIWQYANSREWDTELWDAVATLRPANIPVNKRWRRRFQNSVGKTRSITIHPRL